MNELLLPQYGRLKQCWTDGGNGEVKRSAIAFVLLILLSFAACMLVPSLRETLFSFVSDLFFAMDLTDESGRLSAPALLLNNLQACTMIMLYGLIPFLHLTALALGMNAMLLGVLAAHYAVNGISILAYLAALVPHGIFEFPALILAFAMGLYVCGQLTRRCRHDASALPLGDCLLLILRLLVLVLLPLLAAAALVEAYITPLLAAMFF